MSDAAPNRHRPRALVLEPEAATAAALQAALGESGFQTQIAARPNTASAMIQVAVQEQEPFRLLVVSRMVGGICGLSLGTALCARAGEHAPLFLLNGGPYDAPQAQELERAGCRGVVAKPLDLAQLLALVSEALPAGTDAGSGRRLAL